MSTFFPEWRELRTNAIYIRQVPALAAQGYSTKPKNGDAPAEPGGNGRQQMARLLKLVVVLVVLGFAALVGYAYLGDLTPATEEIRQPVTLDAG
jgi:hypothetical protein